MFMVFAVADDEAVSTPPPLPYSSADSSPVERASLVMPPILIGMRLEEYRISPSTQVPTHHLSPKTVSHGGYLACRHHLIA